MGNNLKRGVDSHIIKDSEKSGHWDSKMDIQRKKVDIEILC